MSTNKSEHLNLHLWEPEDDFLRTEFNENFEKIDAGVKAEENARAAAMVELEAKLTNTGGAASSALAQVKQELLTEIQSVQAAADAAQATADAAYSPQQKPYVLGSYVGTGTYGTKNPTKLTLGFQPSIVFVLYNGELQMMATRKMSAVKNLTLSWLEDGVSWYNTQGEILQMNSSGTTYYYVAFQ